MTQDRVAIASKESLLALTNDLERLTLENRRLKLERDTAFKNLERYDQMKVDIREAVVIANIFRMATPKEQIEVAFEAESDELESLIARYGR